MKDPANPSRLPGLWDFYNKFIAAPEAVDVVQKGCGKPRIESRSGRPQYNEPSEKAKHGERGWGKKKSHRTPYLSNLIPRQTEIKIEKEAILTSHQPFKQSVYSYL